MIREYMINNEVILLRAVYDHIDDMVNFSLMDIRSSNNASMVMFKDMNQRRLFFILLADFISKTDNRGPIKKTSFLSGISAICDNPQFSVKQSEIELRDSVKSFRQWLLEKKQIEIWMPSIGEDVKLSISRLDSIKMSGDISKHNYLRAIGVAEDLQKILSKSGVNIEIEEALLALPDFHERFHEDILIYLSSHICEFLNNIRWAIHTYLQPEFNRSFHYKNGKTDEYGFHVPDAINSKYAHDCYWELMNHLRNKPYMQKIVVSESFKCEY